MLAAHIDKQAIINTDRDTCYIDMREEKELHGSSHNHGCTLLAFSFSNINQIILSSATNELIIMFHNTDTDTVNRYTVYQMI